MPSAQQSNEEVIFNTARKIDSVEARQEYLEQVCAGDASLRERVDHLLQSQADESQFLEAPALEPTQAWAPIHEQPGERIGRYKLLQRIGEGGFGVVYMAEQEKPVRRKVALKII
ncbi:MAG: serine/threonine protein kinase, partial [Planctomycetaceae bacterium]|nr:serine/threonine protein kinase [Planctomycetaceae bacterium]